MPVPRPYPRVPAPVSAAPLAVTASSAAAGAAAERFTFFWRGPFSQWHHSPFRVDGVLYENGEKWMMAGKARLFGDEAALAKMLKISNPQALKALGRSVSGFVEQTWTQHRVGIVREGNRHKFEQNPELLEKLLATEGTTLVEASPYDQIWGIGLAASDPRAQRRETWRGQNLLGDDVLTWLRDEFRRELETVPKP